MISCKVSTFDFTVAPRERPTKAATTASNLKPTKFESFGCCTCSSSSAGLTSASDGFNDEPERKLVADEEGRKVHSEVEVISWRERRIKGQVTDRADVLSVWNVITDYERLADFIPNLVSSGRIPCPHPGRIWLEQRGIQRSMYWHIEARVVLDLQEIISSADSRELQFCMVDGDFKKFDGKWTVKSGTRRGTTILSYEVNVLPRFNFPAIFLERIIASDLPVNLRAVACQAERDFADNRKTGVGENELSINMLSSGINSFLNQKDKISTEDSKQTGSGSSFGHGTSSTKELNGNWGVFGKVCKLKQPAMVDEVHLRRFDGLLAIEFPWLLLSGYPISQVVKFVISVLM